MYIAIVDYNMGNISSVTNAFKRTGAELKVTSKPGVIKNACGIVLPGVGAFRDAIGNLEELGLTGIIKESLKTKPFLGICLGMQLLFEYSMENGKSEGLGILKGYVDRINAGVKVPHMGWNSLDIRKKDSRVLEGITGEDYFYFVHSYHVIPAQQDIISSTAYYGTGIVSSIEKGNIYGFQFHPEKSSLRGQVLIKNFLKLTEEAK
ncbi:MAG: imidazole glycerol phosphate synthase subunit HisH [Actinobacteria bacterium]|nr:imidazole glycerol phosphate synthase subunit HisH [Actinomycetota bacterium]